MFLPRAILAGLVLALSLPAGAQAATWVVEVESDTPDGRSCPGFTGCSLREALTSANANPGTDTLIVDPGTYALTGGQLDVTDAVRIVSEDANGTVIDAGDRSRIFSVGVDVDLTLRDLTLRNGAGVLAGGAVRTVGDLFLERVIVEASDVSDSTGDVRGGAVAADGDILSVEGSTFRRNTASGLDSTTARGGAVATGPSTLALISDSTFSDNLVSDGTAADGGALAARGETRVQRSAFRTNSTAGDDASGGAVHVTAAELRAEASEFSSNTVVASSRAAGGAIAGDVGDVTLDDVTIAANAAIGGSQALGGGIATEGGRVLTVTASRVHDNLASAASARGGGVAVTGPGSSITASTIDHNSAASGGDARGGGIATLGPATLTATNATIVWNIAEGPDASATVLGAGLWVAANASPDEVVLEAATVADNDTETSGTVDGGEGGAIASDGAQVQALGSILAGNRQNNSFADCDGVTVASLGGNVLAADPRGSCAPAAPEPTDHTMRSGSVWFGPFGDHGGPTPTMVPDERSPALDRYATGCPATDQRGVPRPQGAQCDSGATERALNWFAATPAALDFPDTVVGQTSAGQTLTVENLGDVDATPDLQVAGADASSFALSGCDAPLAPAATCTATVTFSPTAAGDRAAEITGLADPVELTGTGLVPAPACSAVDASTAYDTATTVVPDCTPAPTSVAIADPPTHGTATVDAGTFTYTPAAGYFGSDTFTYTGTNSTGTSSPATVTVTVNPPPPPACADTTLTVPYETSGPVTLPCTGEIDGYAITTGPSDGAAGLAGAVLTYTPDAGYVGPDAIAFTASGPGGTSVAAEVAVTVSPPPDPVCADGTLAVAYETEGDVALDCTGVITGWTVVDEPEHGTVLVDAAGVATYTPDAGFSGPDTFVFRADGPGGTASDEAEIAVTVGAPPPPPAAPPSAASCADVLADTTAGTPVTVTLACGATTWSWSILAGPDGGSLGPVDGAGRVTYTPAAGFSGVDRFTYRANGPDGGSPAASVIVRVAPVPAEAASAQPAAGPPARCAGRQVVIRLNPRGVRFTRARVTVDGVRVRATRDGERWVARLDLRAVRADSVTLRVVARRADGRLQRASRSVSVCG